MSVFDGFSPEAYLAEYYSEISSENDALLKFSAENADLLEPCGSAVEIGGGPTIYQLISTAAACDRITFCDYLQSNLDQVRAWALNSPEGYDWSAFIETSLRYERKNCGPDAVTARANVIKQKLARYLRCDAFHSNPIGDRYRHSFDLVGSHFVAEGITSDRRDWERVMANILTLLKPGGHIFMSFVSGADYWLVSGKKYPACKLSRDDIFDYLRAQGFSVLRHAAIPAVVPEPDADGFEGYTGLVSVIAKRA